jgi:hypothetical protein
MEFPFLSAAFDELTRLRALSIVHWILSIVLQRTDIKFRDRETAAFYAYK